MIDIAMSYKQAGVSIIPLRLDGSKAPALPAGGINEFKERIATDTEVESWFKSDAGIGLLGGPVSGGLEILDFDHDAERVYAEWFKLVSDIVVWLPVVETPSHGYHVLYRCQEVTGSHKIASDPTADKATLIESRGFGGYVVGCGSPQAVHSKPFPYVQVAGPALPQIPTISVEDRHTLWKAARLFDKCELRKKAIKKLSRKRRSKPKTKDGTLTPWDDFNSRGDWDGLLRRVGWTSRDAVHWTRPGKSSGTSATLRETEDSTALVLCVFSSSTCLEPSKSHSMFSVYAHYVHRGDKSAAAKELINQGYGGQA